MGCFEKLKKLCEETAKNSPMNICVNEEKLAEAERACLIIDSIYSNDSDLTKDGIKVFEDGVLDIAVSFPSFYIEASKHDMAFAMLCGIAKRMELGGSKENGVSTKAVFGDLFKYGG